MRPFRGYFSDFSDGPCVQHFQDTKGPFLKGQPPANGKVKAGADIHCNVRLLAGQDYAFFLYQDNFVRGLNEGTTHFAHVQNVDAKWLLEQIREEHKERWKRTVEGDQCLARGEGKSLSAACLAIGRAKDCQSLYRLCRSPHSD
jgi:hypothetical protein